MMITTQETTVAVSGLTTVEFDRRYPFYGIRNDSSSAIQVSTVNAECVEGADGVVTVAKDSSFIIANCGDKFNGTMLYLNGNGTVTVVGQYSDSNRFKVAGKGGDLEAKITQEATTRAAADTALNSRIDNIVSGATTDTEIIDARQPTVGTAYDTLKARLDGENSKLDFKKVNQLGINLARSENVIKTSTQEATKVENDDGTITITPAVSYGRYNVCVNIEPSDKAKYYYVAYKFKADSYTKNVPTVYAFIDNTTNLGTVTAVQVNLTSKNDDYGYRCRSFIFKTSVAQSTANVLQMGIMTNTNVPYTIQPNPFVVVDVTDLYSDKTDLMNFTSLFGFDHYDSADITNKTICNVTKRISNIDPVSSNWDGKNAIVIGDSITAAGKWQTKLTDMLGITVTTHAKGGVGAVAMVDGDGGTLNPLSTDDVSNKDLIIVLPAYNNRSKPDGVVGDCYSPDGTGQDTIAGIIQYTINRIYDTLKDANNLKCKILYATPHCAGKYPYNDVDGYGEYPAGTGRTMETLGNTIIAVCNHNNIPVCDLWHNSGINKFTWDVFGANANAVNSQYSPYELDASGSPTSNTRIKYVKGQSYYQIRDGEVVLEEYTDSAPYPYNGDQLHCCDNGYARIGECIVGSIIEHYGS